MEDTKAFCNWSNLTIQAHLNFQLMRVVRLEQSHQEKDISTSRIFLEPLENALVSSCCASESFDANNISSRTCK